MRIFAYILKVDSGFSPNPFHGWCTLACCKPAIRRKARPGDWIVGITPKKLDNQLAYAMRVDESLTFTEYWSDRRFRGKRPPVAVWSKYSNAQRVSSLHLSKGCLNPASRSDTYSFRVRSSLPASSPRSRFEPAVRTPGGPVVRHPQPRGRKPALRREIPWILRGFQGRLSC